MELDEQKKKVVIGAISDVAKASGGIAYNHFVEYKFQNSLERPERNKYVDYNIYNKTYSEAVKIWIEGLTTLNYHDIHLKTNLFGKNFTEELYFSGEKRVSLHIVGKKNPYAIKPIYAAKPIQIEIAECTTPSGYKYYNISFYVNKLIPVLYSSRCYKGPYYKYLGDHGDFMKHVKDDLPSISSSIGYLDFIEFDKEITNTLGKYSDLKKSEDAIRMAILFTWPTTENPEKSYVALIPPAFEIPGKNGEIKQITAGGIALFSNNPLVLPPSSPLFDRLQNWVSIHTTKQLVEYSKVEATKSAKAAIMSRNMSHNIGSHVMSYLKQNLSSVRDILKNGVLNNILGINNIVQENGKSRLRSSLDKDVEDIALPFLVGMGHFVSYLQERQDFIATVATDYIPYNSTINFKDDIYDVLNPDKRVLRHVERTTSMATNNILIENIARSEGLGRTNNKEQEGRLKDIVFKFRSSFNGDPVAPGTIFAQELEEMRKYDLSLPGGILGRQAFFSIMENIIRNAAKHGDIESGKDLEFTFDLFSKEDVLSKQRDSLKRDDGVNGSRSLYKVLKDYYINAQDGNELFFLTITDNCDCTEESLGKLRKALIEDYLEEGSSKMNNSNKGLKEMRISAAWLRSIRKENECFQPMPSKEKPLTKLSAEEFNSDEYWGNLEEGEQTKAPLIYARLSQLENKDWALQYIICLPIPQKIAIVSDSKEFTLSDTVKQHFQECYWTVFTSEEFCKVHNKSYEFIICDCDVYNKVRPFATSRIIHINAIMGLRKALIDIVTGTKLINEAQDGIMNQLYRHFAGLSNDLKTTDISLLVADGAAVSHSTNICVNPSSVEGEFQYRTHHETAKQFFSFMNSLNRDGKRNIAFVEGITGSNSTDRLIRHDMLDDIWYCRHLHAMKQQIAIFDERLFSRITGREECDLYQESVKTEGYKALTFIQKGIFPFTMVLDGEKYKVIGCSCERKENNKYSLDHIYDDNYECQCVCLAEIKYSKEDGLLQIEPEEGAYIKNWFNYVTIHQGLLDKLYETFDIKDSPKKKIDVSTKLYNYLSVHAQNNGKCTHSFQSGFTIHSGRSKPNRCDMPQQLPFIQYAALEHAVFDCKYTIVELLDNARYEDEY